MLAAENLEKKQKKELEAQAKAVIAEAKTLEKSGQLAEARTKYAESQAMIEVKEAAEAIKRLDDEIHKRLRDALNQSRKLYEAHKYKEAASALEESTKLGGFEGMLSSNLALCYYQLGDRNKAVENLDKAITDTPDPKKKVKLRELLTFLVTGENSTVTSEDERKRTAELNRLIESIGFDASLQDEEGSEEETTSVAESDSPTPQLVSEKSFTKSTPTPHATHSVANRKSSMCTALEEFKGNAASSPSAVYDRANCAEINGRAREAIRLLQKYLELSPQALDADAARERIVELQSLVSLPEQKGVEVRREYASAYGYLAERKYDRALAAFSRAKESAPDFPLTYWKLGLMYEAFGNVDQARANFTQYEQLLSDDAEKNEASLHLTTLDAKKSKYQNEVSEAEEILSDLFNRGMNLSFNLDANRSAIRVRRARVKNKKQQNWGLIGGFAVPFPYAQQQLARAAEHLQLALALFPLGTEANELTGLVFLQANDGRAALKNFDAVASQGLPVSFYAEMRGRKLDHAVKCELSHDRVRFIFLSSYDKRGAPTAPDKAAGDDGLGDITLAPGSIRGEFDSLDLILSDIKKVETHNGILVIKLAKQEFALSPIYLPSYTPIQGPQARRFANNYTRLFIRYPGLEDSKLGAEGMTGGEKFKMGMSIATDSLNIATSLNPIGSIQAAQSAISIARTIHSAMASLSVSFAAWERSVDDQQQLLSGPAFKTIPSEPVSLAAMRE
jgi:tetratricopeptide (TPR) repeat protein